MAIKDRMPAREVRDHFAETLKAVGRGRRVVVTRHKKVAAVLVSAEDLALLEWLEDQQDIADAKKALEDIAANGSIPWEQVKAELGL